ncbi:MAG: hypothetical protein N3B21_06585 [Clostridia bacterium]|nr:hypothetical protein [Clostridia bacterium]
MDSKVKKHSVYGIASFIIFFTVILLELVVNIGLIALSTSNIIGFNDMHIVILFMKILFVIEYLTFIAGIVFGIVGLASKNFKKVFSTTGMVLNSLMFVFYTIRAINMIL